MKINYAEVVDEFMRD